MARIPHETIQKIIQANDIVGLIESYMPLEKKSASNYFGLCPFHDEKSPSFSVSPSKQFYYCFGCKSSGNVIGFVQHMEHCDFLDAVKFLAERAKIPLDLTHDPAAKAKEAARKQSKAMRLEAARYYYRLFQSPEGQEARAYMEERRSFDTGTLRAFGIGYAGSSWDGLERHLRSKGFQQEAMLREGLVKESQKGSVYDLFRERVIFPIFDAFGSLVAFGGRLIKDGQPKYINSPESRYYTKGRHLFGLNLARKERADSLIVTEGYLDVMRLYQAGFRNVVAGLGTALTSEQMTLIMRFADTVILAYDADRAGQEATERGIYLAKRAGLQCKVLLMPGGKDPDDYLLEQGPTGFKVLLKHALPVLDYRMHRAYQEASSTLGTVNFLEYQRAVVDLLSKEDDRIVAELYAGKLAEEIGVAQSTVLREIQRRRDQKAGKELSSLPAERRPPKQLSKLSRSALLIFHLMMTHQEAIKQLKEPVSAEDFPEAVQDFYRALEASLKTGPLNFGFFVQLMEETGLKESLREQVIQYLNEAKRIPKKEAWSLVVEAIRHLRMERMREARDAILQGQTSGTAVEQMEALNQYSRKMAALKNREQSDFQRQ